MSDESIKCSAATPSGDLLRDLMDPNIPKSEREWFARSYIQEMVKKAAENSLDGYRELGQRAADAENELDAQDATIASLREEIAGLKAKLGRANTLLQFAWDDVKTASLRKQIFEYMRKKP